MSITPEFVIFILYFIWFLILTFLFLRFYLYYSKLVKNGKKDSIVALLNELSSQEESNKKTIEKLVQEYDKLKKEGLSHIQKVGLTRFNPFKDTGGDQSFIITFLDAHDSGVLISGLHTRGGTRWYAKTVVKGKGEGYELSADEKKALQSTTVLH